MKRYYLETNALYSLAKVKEECISESFTSFLSLFEIISGISRETFQKRKALVNKIKERKLEVDWRMPEEIIFSSFEFLRHKFTFTDNRKDFILRLYENIHRSSSYDELLDYDTTEKPTMGLTYFQGLDSRYSSKYIDATIAGNRDIRLSLKSGPQEPVVVGDRIYPLDTYDNIRDFFTTEFTVNRSFTILAFAEGFCKGEIERQGISPEQIYNSYSGLVDSFINCYPTTIRDYLPRVNNLVGMTLTI